MNWSYQGSKACTVLVGENTDAKPSSSEANKTSTSSTSTTSQSGGRTRQPSSSGGSISTSDSMLLDGVVYSRKRREAFNEHALHQTVTLPPPRDSEEPSLIPTALEAEASGFEQRSVPLHEKFPGKVHDSEHGDGPGPAKEAVDRSIEANEVTEESLVVNVSATTTNYSHDHTTHITVADHLSSSSSVSVGSGHSSASTSEFNRESPDDEASGTTSSWLTEIFPVVDKDTVDALEKSATREEHVATKAPIAKLVRDDSADFDRDTDNASTSESSDIGESGDGIEATTSASDVESAKLGADSSDYDRVVGGTTENDSNVSPVDYNGNIDATIVEAVTEVRSIELTEDQGSNVSNFNTSEQLVSVEMDRNKVDASTVSPNINDEKTTFNALLSNDEKIKESEENIIKIEGEHDKSKEKIISDENNRSVVFTEDISKTINMTTKSIKSQMSDIVKETRELSQESSSSESEASFNIVNPPEQSEELQKDYPLPIYNYGQDEIEIVDFHHKKQSIAKAKNPTKTEILDNNVKMKVVSRKGRQNKDDVRIIMREESDDELLRKFKEKFHEAAADVNEPVENSSLIRTNYNSPPTNTLHETVHDSSDNASPRFPSNTDHLSNSPITQRVQIVEVPVYRDAHSGLSSSSSSSSPHRVLINVTIAAENPSAASSRPLYILSVSVPTEDGHSSGINIDQAQVPPAASMKKIPAKDAESISVVDTRLPPPPQPPASPPAPIWAGGECECSCPCMGSSSDEWDNFSAIDDNLEQELESVNATMLDDEFLESGEKSADGREQDTESAVKDSAKTNATISTTENYYLSTMDDLAKNSESIDGSSTSTYEPEVSTDPWACSGSTALPPEPTILILEGEATFTIVSLSLFLSLFLSFSLCLIFSKTFLFKHVYFLSFVNAHFFAYCLPMDLSNANLPLL